MVAANCGIYELQADLYKGYTSNGSPNHKDGVAYYYLKQVSRDEIPWYISAIR